MRDFVYQYKGLLRESRSREALYRFSSDPSYDVRCLDYVTGKLTLEVVCVYMFNLHGLETTGVTVATLLAFIMTVKHGYRNVPFQNEMHALQCLHSIHHMVHSVRASTDGTSYITAIQTLFLLMAGVCHGLDGGMASSQVAGNCQSLVCGCMHRSHALQSHAAGVALIAAKETGFLDNLPMRSVHVFRSLVRSTDASCVLPLVTEIQAFRKWMESLTEKNRKLALQVARKEVEEVLPTMLIVTNSVLGTEQYMLMRGILVLACTGSIGKTGFRERWKDEQRIHRVTEMGALGISRQWIGREEERANAFHTCHRALLDQMRGLSAMMKLTFLTSLLERLRGED
ncbi:hypothetical protein KIPB_005934 [Kipferlia bialata]|uniref:PDEase domain-containing protein n=1 Tax=Kipferlia bialata TaxID=797122 RepID=A0A9K3CY48_9EUKA|nr:hypothetical protein KIPB_001212 [Kipferlia bialata]GIQ84443.1 hypothetical protein KIPB_005934 [Kipferlia bialata]|eukprot:g1212.t1